MKVNTMEIIQTLVRRAKKQDSNMLLSAIAMVNSINSLQSDIDNAINTTRSAGYTDLAHFLELLNLDHFEVNISDEYKFHLNI